MAVPGHGALIAIELDPVGAPGVFTTLGELNEDITMLDLSRPTTETTPHNADIDGYITGVLKRGELPVSVNFIFGNTGHMALRNHVLNNTVFKLQILSATGSAGTDEVIYSGTMSGFKDSHPVREGARTAEAMFRPSGQMTIDGVDWGVPA